MRPGSSTTTTPAVPLRSRAEKSRRQRRPPCRLDPARRRAAENVESRPAPTEDHALLLVDAKGMLYFELLPQGRTVAASIFTDQLEELAAAI
ncbi:unnamed protein product [Caenorhabditis auriculariae]|uniref:Uncharacterized protein n=1 Tax=Caenorhabditis auriculariae TaxID=2777116 RepID=A0A8S1HV93_9PELO|nr:unnamed protein product [Caenorhabditis auriculariae]